MKNFSAKGLVSACLSPLIRRAARGYIAGDTLADAVRVASALRRTGHLATLAYWDAAHHSATQVMEQYLAALAELGQGDVGSLSVKLPSLRYSPELVDRLITRACRAGVHLHFDSLGPETADPTRAMVDRLLAGGERPELELGYTLPARWTRSLVDADWAVERRLKVRVVKGQWKESSREARDLRAAYLGVIDRLAGRARHVGVASHDVPLAAEALRRLQAAGTPCELELLHGLPTVDSVALAARTGVSIRFYVPYGKAYLPYALGRLHRNPRMAWWMLKDLVAPDRRAASARTL